MTRLRALRFLAVCLLAWATPALADTPRYQSAPGAPVKLALHLEADGFTKPVLLTHAGDGSGRRFIVEQPGQIRVLHKNGAVTTFVDLHNRVKNGGERGLLGLAFHPQFAENGRLFVYLTDLHGDIVIAELAAPDKTVADPDSLKVLMTISNPATNHNGGMIAFGPDGYLYFGTGDGGGAGDPFQTAQNTFSHLGKILRIDVDHHQNGRPYGIPADNPFVDRTTYRPEIWALGLRNPWRFSFDRANGDLYIADVGQDSWEEINHQPANSKGGVNYGWSHMEGHHCFPPSKKRRCSKRTHPVAEYSHDDGCSVTGGYVYRGKLIPKLVGTYLFSDYCSGTVWGLTQRKGGTGSFRMQRLLETDLHVSGFGEDEDGALYLLDHRRGALYRIVPKGWTAPAKGTP